MGDKIDRSKFPGPDLKDIPRLEKNLYQQLLIDRMEGKTKAFIDNLSEQHIKGNISLSTFKKRLDKQLNTPFEKTFTKEEKEKVRKEAKIQLRAIIAKRVQEKVQRQKELFKEPPQPSDKMFPTMDRG